ncbi:MAG: YdcF family protein [Sulfitobacter sp.]
MTGGLPVAVVLGAAVWKDGQPSPTLKRRTAHAAQLFHDGLVEEIVTTGGVGKHAPSEASVAKSILLTHGVPEHAITLEDRSTTTLENLTFAKAAYGGLENRAVVLVTDRFHTPRAWLTGKSLGLACKTSCPKPQGWFTAQVGKSYLREAVALPYYAFKLARLKVRYSQASDVAFVKFPTLPWRGNKS